MPSAGASLFINRTHLALIAEILNERFEMVPTFSILHGHNSNTACSRLRVVTLK